MGIISAMRPNTIVQCLAGTLAAVLCACGGSIDVAVDSGPTARDADTAAALGPTVLEGGAAGAIPDGGPTVLEGGAAGAIPDGGPTVLDASDAQTSADGGPPPPSCRTSGAGRTDCGASRESCCTSLEVTGGTYYRTYTNSGDGPTGEGDPATVSAFRLDKYLVTVGRFRQFVNAWNGGSGFVPPARSGKHTHLNGGRGLKATGGGYEPGWVASDDANISPIDANLACSAASSTWTTTAGGQEDLPINCSNWFDAYAFCIWDGGFLPSEAEWEYASAGGTEEREFAWGTAAPGTGNRYAIYNCDYPSGTGNCTGVTNIAPVGTATLGVGRWGQLDLAGDLWEWNLDWLATNYVVPCTDCADLTEDNGRVIRGGNWAHNMSAALLPPARGFPQDPSVPSSAGGMRCARTP